jgi:hypothetical protein
MLNFSVKKRDYSLTSKKEHHQEEGTSRCKCPGSGDEKGGGSDVEGKSGE